MKITNDGKRLHMTVVATLCNLDFLIRRSAIMLFPQPRNLTSHCLPSVLEVYKRVPAMIMAWNFSKQSLLVI